MIRADGKPDRVDCGRGDDLVSYHGRDRGDRFISCEHLKPYGP